MNAGLVFAAAWALSALVMWRPTFRVVVRESSGSYPADGGDLFAGIFFGTILVCLLGPALLAWGILKVAVFRDADPAAVARCLGGESRAEKIERLEAEARDREWRVRHLERELLR